MGEGFFAEDKEMAEGSGRMNSGVGRGEVQMSDHLGMSFIGNIQDDHIAPKEVGEIRPIAGYNGMVQADSATGSFSGALPGQAPVGDPFGLEGIPEVVDD